MVSLCVGGITLIIIPLLALTANQLSRLHAAVQRYGDVVAVHLDETGRDDLINNVIPKMVGLSYQSSESLVLLCSPQYLAETKEFRDALLVCNARRTLRLVAVDEAHVYAMHGRSFRASIRALGECFFSVVFAAGAAYTPLFLAMTATMPLVLLEVFSRLTHVNWMLAAHQLWSSAVEFQQRNVTFALHVRGGCQTVRLTPRCRPIEQRRPCSRVCVCEL